MIAPEGDVGCHPGLAEIPAPVGFQDVVATPMNANCWPVLRAAFTPACQVAGHFCCVKTITNLLVHCGCGKQLPGTQRVNLALLTQGEFALLTNESTWIWEMTFLQPPCCWWHDIHHSLDMFHSASLPAHVAQQGCQNACHSYVHVGVRCWCMFTMWQQGCPSLPLSFMFLRSRDCIWCLILKTSTSCHLLEE